LAPCHTQHTFPTRRSSDLTKNEVANFRIDHRVKGLWSLWQKLKRKGGEIAHVYDVAALRVVVGDAADCYRVLGIAHNLWQPLPRSEEHTSELQSRGHLVCR